MGMVRVTMPCAFLLVILPACVRATYNIVGWYDLRQQYVDAVPPTDVNYSAVTHLVLGAPGILPDGTVNCTSYTNSSTTEAEIRRLAVLHGVKMQWVLTDATAKLIDNKNNFTNKFLATLPAAAKRCECDGIEFDYEPGTSQTRAQADTYTELLVSIKETMGEAFVVSADIAAWTDIPYVTPSKMTGSKGVGVDFVNLMSYFFDGNGSVGSYQDALDKVVLQWGFNASRVNLGIPFYDSGQSAWADISSRCPNANPRSNSCQGTLFVGKEMNARLGQLAQAWGVAGVFPWQLNYDTAENNNTLFPWLLEGLTQRPPLPYSGAVFVPPTGSPYIYKTRQEAPEGCAAHGFRGGLCAKEMLLGKSNCMAGWTSDWEGYWMATAVAGCGHAGFNDWSGPAGAYCCNSTSSNQAR